MRKILFASLMTVAISALMGCKEKTREVPVIPVEYSDTKNFLDVMADKRTYIFLDDKSLDATVSEIYQVMIDDDKLFISYYAGTGPYNEDKNISVFDMEGQFINKISRVGRARNEYVRLESWCLDTDLKQVIINDAFNSLKRFSYDNEYVSSLPLGDYDVWNVMYVNGHVYGGMLMPNDKADDIVEIKDDGTVKPLLPFRGLYDDNFSMGGGIGSSRQYMANDLKEFYHLRLFDNILYEIDGDKADTCKMFDFMIPAVNKEVDFLNSGMLDYRPSYTIENGSYFIFETNETDEQGAINAFQYYVYDKSNEKCTRYRAEIDKDYANIIINFKIVGIDNDYVITRATPRGAQYILDNIPDKIPQSDLEMMKILATRDNEAIILHHIK